MEKMQSSRSNQSLKSKDKTKADNTIRPPYADLPFEFVMDVNNRTVVQTRYSGNQQQLHASKNGSKVDEELVKYMSKVPGYLHRGGKPQDNILNFGVLDWGSLQKWKHKHNHGLGRDHTNRSSAGTSVAVKSGTLSYLRDKPSASHVHLSYEVDSSLVAKASGGKEIHYKDNETSSVCRLDEQQKVHRKEKFSSIDVAELNSVKGKTSDSRRHRRRTSSSKLNDHGLSVNSIEKTSIIEDEQEKSAVKVKRSECNPPCENFGGCSDVSRRASLDEMSKEKAAAKSRRSKRDLPHENFSGKQENIILIVPRDFSRDFSDSGYSDVSQRASLDGKSTELNWGSFSDIFSVGEIQMDESFSDVPHSCPLPYTAETEKELDIKLDDLIRAQSMEHLSDPLTGPTFSTGLNETPQAVNRIKDEESNVKEGRRAPLHKDFHGFDEEEACSKDAKTRDPSPPYRFSFGMGRLTRSLSFKEGMTLPHLRSTYVTAKSGPAGPGSSACCDNPNSNKGTGRARSSPLRRLLDPLLKSRVANLFNSVDISQPLENCERNFGAKPIIANEVLQNGKCPDSTVRALVHLTVKSGLPLFKFVVETNNEIFASTVKSLSIFGEDDTCWLYTFYSMRQVRKKSGTWKNQKNKSSGLAYDVVGQMKVSNPHVPSWSDQDSNGKYIVRESVLCSIDVSKADMTTPEFTEKTELAAIVVNTQNETLSNDGGKSNDKYVSKYVTEESEQQGDITVILPGGIHSMPTRGVPSSLINRWKSGGLCDCGGWDVGCKLRILSNQDQHQKILATSLMAPAQERCDLFDQGLDKQTRPVLSLLPYKDGLYSVEFDTTVSSLQAFSICVAIINSKKKPPGFPNTSIHNDAKREHDETKHAPHPPLSPVGRV